MSSDEMSSKGRRGKWKEGSSRHCTKSSLIHNFLENKWKVKDGSCFQLELEVGSCSCDLTPAWELPCAADAALKSQKKEKARQGRNERKTRTEKCRERQRDGEREGKRHGVPVVAQW